MDSLQELRVKRRRFLKALYETTGPNTDNIVLNSDIGEPLGLSKPEIEEVTQYLSGEGLLLTVTMAGHVSMTHAGIKLVESELASASQQASVVFYSWQSDLPNSTNRGFIGRCLEDGVKQLRSDATISVEPVIDRDTIGVPGSPDIALTIFQKIDNCHVFVCDVTITTRPGDQRPTPNPNVLIELGYAIKALGWSRIVMVMNVAYGQPAELPFDLRMKRVMTYESRADDESRVDDRKSLTGLLTSALRLIYGVPHTSTQDETPVKRPAEPTLRDERPWCDRHRKDAIKGFRSAKLRTWMEVFATTSNATIQKNQKELLDIANSSMIHTYGWPIGVMDRSNPHFTPKPVVDGIVGQVAEEGEYYDYWALRRDGVFYLLKSLAEEKFKKDKLYFDTRIVRTTEVCLYLNRLYESLGLDPDTSVALSLGYTGLRGWKLGATNLRPCFHIRGPVNEDSITGTVATTVRGLREHVGVHVKELTRPLFMLFDYFELDDNNYDKIINGYVAGQIQ